MTCRLSSHSRVATPQDSQEAKLLPDEVASVNGHASDLATNSNVVLDSEDVDCPDQTDSTVQTPRAANLNDQDHITPVSPPRMHSFRSAILVYELTCPARSLRTSLHLRETHGAGAVPISCTHRSGHWPALPPPLRWPSLKRVLHL
ncbi:hypothetical protein SCLCIDRAFT_621796 [Scleroderma citrinum Foug A]|uniref:Uncharacterized protein n=1 Tax=Scleroderma citrinum Foug A TaxID=1036808 RepID=A0A0C3D5K3_9AGAM|nr:hypothetical protein SCLCIDRAFT_621796 [Scleroderma citrinum Foug A]